jgi:hypothetical protein
VAAEGVEVAVAVAVVEEVGVAVAVLAWLGGSWYPHAPIKSSTVVAIMNTYGGDFPKRDICTSAIQRIASDVLSTG